MANVLFKRGMQSGLPQGSNIVDGALYFTTDTKRLFLGNNGSNGLELLPISEGIQVVTSVAALPEASEHNGEFYFISGENILAWSNGATWLQTNKNTTLKNGQNAIVSTSVANNAATVTTTVQDSDNKTATGNFKIISGTANVSVTAGAGTNEVAISVDPDTTYSIDTAASGNDVEIQLKSTKANDDSAIVLKDSASVNVIRNDDGSISFGVDASGVGAVSDLDIIEGSGTISGAGDAKTATSSNGFTVEVDMSNGTKKFASTDPTIKYGTEADQEVHFVSGTATLDVMTTTEVTTLINDLEKNINAMTYMGVVDAYDANDAGTDKLTSKIAHNGDVYLATESFSIPANKIVPTPSGNDPVEVKPGYMVVMQGNEITDPSQGTVGTIPADTVKYVVVAGNDTDTQYQVETKSHGIKIKSGNAVTGEIGLTAGQGIDLTDTVSGGKSNTIEVAVSDVTRSDGTATSTVQVENGTGVEIDGGTAQQTFAVVTGVSTNSRGQVTGVSTTNLTLKDTHIDLGNFETSITGSNAEATPTSQATVQMQSNGAVRKALNFKLASSSLAVSKATSATDTVQVDLVWGNF